MVNLIKRPIGHKLDVNAQSGTASNSGGDVLINTGSAHGLSDGDYIFVDSNIDSYNGFRYVDSVAYNTFKLKESENGDYIPFKQAVTITFYISVLNHYWQCVHLPIVYELESTLFPNNTAEESYQPNTVVSFSNNAGYVQLDLAQALSDPEELTKIELVGGTMAGVYQIITVLQPWSVVIDLAYDSGYSFTGSVVVKYYDNYAINVNVYAGLESGHPWEAEKPFELAATLRFIPDENNEVKFSISEVLKGYIQSRNKLDLDTLPNNTDFMVSFYIEYFETYDQSDGEEVTTFTSDITTDTVIGYATNSKLEFKNLYSGHMSDYLGTEDHLAQWLTTMDRPIIVVGQFFDISFINQYEGNIRITNYKSTIGTTDEEITEIVNPGKGILRIPLEGESPYVQYCIQASTVGQPEETTAMDLPALSTWLNIDDSKTDWNEGATPDISLPGSAGTQESDKIGGLFTFLGGYEYSIDINFTRTNPSLLRFYILILDVNDNIIHTDSTTRSPGTGVSDTASMTFTASGIEKKISVRIGPVVIITPEAATEIELTSYSGTQTSPAIPAENITEQLCISVIEECNSTFVDDYRLTEGNNLRALE